MPEATAAPRNVTLDGLKYVAAAAIVLHHVSAGAGGRLGAFMTAAPLWALFFFIAASGYLHGGVGDRGPAWLRKRLVRLGVPYATWTVVYLVWGQRNLLIGGPPFLPNAFRVVFFAGANEILWVLPLLLYCAVAAELLVHNSIQRRITIGACILLTLALYQFAPLREIYTGPVQHFILAPRWFAVYLGGMELRALGEMRPPGLLARAAFPVSVLAAGTVGVLYGDLTRPLSITVQTVLWSIGAFVLLWGAASGVTWLGVGRLAWGSDYLIGVYVSHVLWLQLFLALVPRAGGLPGSVWIAAGWAFTLAGATLTTLALKSNKVTRPIVV